jgi:polyvinyl alcohol dehydrogenase (cytochrome)
VVHSAGMKVWSLGAALSLTLIATWTGIVSAQGRRGQLPTGGAMYRQSCAPCHDAGVERAPQRTALKAMSPERVLDAMENG